MDGTLTPPRKPIEWEMVKKLHVLKQYADIGIVTGSGLNYLIEQCNLLWSEPEGIHPVNIHLLPCNGTQVYRFLDYKWRPTFTTDMRVAIGNETYTKLLVHIFEAQKKLLKACNIVLPFTGNFISYRQSLLNWCPIGRDANAEDRTAFQMFDKHHNYRIKAKRKLEKKLKKEKIEGIEIALGGQTSFDIFPSGWNKTFSLQHFKTRDVWFIGDRCMAGGNDQAIYEVLRKRKRSFKTSGPLQTSQLITENIIPNLQDDA